MLTAFAHYSDDTDPRVVSVWPACGQRVFVCLLSFPRAGRGM